MGLQEKKKSEINMVRKEAYSFDDLIDYLKMLHKSGGDDAVVQFLLIFGEVSKIDDSLDEICYIEEALCYYGEDVTFDYHEGKKYPEFDRIVKRKKELLKKRNALTNSIGMMDNSMFGFRKHHSKYHR